MHHEFSFAYESRVELDMSEPYRASRQAGDEILDDMFQRVVVALWASTQASSASASVNVVDQEDISYQAWERLRKTYLPDSVTGHPSLFQSLIEVS